MFRPTLVLTLTLSALVATGVAGADPGSTKSTKTVKSATARTAKPTKATKSAKRAKKGSHDSRVPTKTTGSNMPRGWVWPPNKPMLASAKACEARLDELNVTWKPGEREGHIVAPIVTDMTFGGVRYVGVYGKGPRKVDCHLAVALETFGQDLFALGVREVHFGSIYRWSKVRVGGLTKNMLSRHALGLAMDIVSFVDDTGREAWVARDYKKDDALLLGIEHAVNASGKFRLLLTPKNDPISHKDHFHLEANPDFTAAPAPVVAASDDPQVPDHLTPSDDVPTP